MTEALQTPKVCVWGWGEGQVWGGCWEGAGRRGDPAPELVWKGRKKEKGSACSLDTCLPQGPLCPGGLGITERPALHSTSHWAALHSLQRKCLYLQG